LPWFPPSAQPVDVVEAAIDVAAVLGGRALVPELRPHLRIVVERGDEIAAQLAKEIGLLDLAQECDGLAIALPSQADKIH
jgi:hypothetical protein